MRQIGLAVALAIGFLAISLGVEAQPGRIYGVGVVHQGGVYVQSIEGLRAGLLDLGFEEGKQFVLDVRDTKGDLTSVEAAAQSLEARKVDVILSLATSVTLAVKRATKSVPIVFYAGTDPVAVGLVVSFRKPEGRLTGIHGQFSDVTGKRLELLKEMVPRIRRPVAFYNPDNPVAQLSLKMARDAANRLKLELVERPIASVAELRAGLQALRPGEVDAITVVSDAMVVSRPDLIIETSMAKRLPIMLTDRASVAGGALAAYGEDYHTLGRHAAKYVQRVLLGANPAYMPIEQVDRLHFAINLKTARALGLTIPQSIRVRADEIIQ
jgi:putative tryptophan/tyrosine transport system substrate-binding protein